MTIESVKNFPKVSIITCVYNGEKYISKLLDSVLNMGYPNIEHIIVNDGSTDSTEEIVMKYVEQYKNKENSNLYIKYIKQKNMGLGGATNTGLKEITGEYWTWINCDDWYVKDAFFEPVEMLLKKPKLDYVQMNGLYYFGETKKEPIIIDKSIIAFKNKKKLFVEYRENSIKFKWLLYICRTSSFRSINPSMSIYPSRYTQDDQLICQIFGVLNGDFCEKPKWYFYQHHDSYQNNINGNLLSELRTIYLNSIKMLQVKKSIKKTLENIVYDAEIVEEIKTLSIEGKSFEALKKIINSMIVRTSISFGYWLHLNHKLFFYFLFSLVPYKIRNGLKQKK